jgi:hypothetical protein
VAEEFNKMAGARRMTQLNKRSEGGRSSRIELQEGGAKIKMFVEQHKEKTWKTFRSGDYSSNKIVSCGLP